MSLPKFPQSTLKNAMSWYFFIIVLVKALSHPLNTPIFATIFLNIHKPFVQEGLKQQTESFSAKNQYRRKKVPCNASKHSHLIHLSAAENIKGKSWPLREDSSIRSIEIVTVVTHCDLLWFIWSWHTHRTIRLWDNFISNLL